MEIHLGLGESEYEPNGFVEAIAYAEQLGFKVIWLGDHFVPWFHSGKQSAFVWSVIAAALKSTDNVKVGPLVTTPIGGRYHPALIAQASATLDNMFPGRFLLGVGTGEAFNEMPFWFDKWPSWDERRRRLAEGIRLVRSLWTREEPFSFNGEFFSSNFYYLYTKPKKNIPIYYSAMGSRSAYEAGSVADNLVTICPRVSPGKLKDSLIPNFKRGLSAVNKPTGEILVHIAFSFEQPLSLLKRASNQFAWMKKNSWSFSNPLEGEKQGTTVTLEELQRNIHFCKDWKDLIGIMDGYKDIGTNSVILSTGPNKQLIREIAENILQVY